MDTESNSTSTQTQQQATTNSDNRKVLGQGALLAEGGSSINVVNTTLDADVAKAALNAGTKGLELAFNFGAKSQSQALDAFDSQASMVKDAYSDAKGRGALTDKILIGAIAMSGLVAIAALRK